MQDSQQSNKSKIFYRVSSRRRLLASIVFLVAAGLLGLLRLAATGIIDVERWINPCGMKQRWGLPCPTCGMTTSVIAFGQGKIIQSFYIQPAAAVLCCILVITAFLAFFIVISGLNFRFLVRIKAKYVILFLLGMVAAGWIITLTRALAVGVQS